MKIMITGGTGYIGAHTCADLLFEGHSVAIVARPTYELHPSVDHVDRIVGTGAVVFRADINDEAALVRIMDTFQPDTVIHLAATKFGGMCPKVNEECFRVNINGTVTLLRAMRRCNVSRLVYSSSTLVDTDPATHTAYATSKVGAEYWINEAVRCNPKLNAVILRYYNVAGAHPTGQLGEDASRDAVSLMTIICQTASGHRPYVPLLGDDHDTFDGSCVRDYVHVCDIARANRAAVEYLQSHTGVFTTDIGTGRGRSVLELVSTFARVNGVSIKIGVLPRRVCDPPRSVAVTATAFEQLHWRASLDLERMCRDAWLWHSAYPDGYPAIPSTRNTSCRQ
jgi:UDP-glucose 4-epimerase